MSMSARKAKRRIVAMMASTILIEFKWMAHDANSLRILNWLQRNQSRVSNLLRKALKHARPA